MDIRHLRYFIAIVENDFNLSRTSQNLYISQPALSMMINDFEQTRSIQLFKRANAKIVGLTYVGENYYRDAKEIVQKYNEMNQNLHKTNAEITGSVTIGIPSFISSTVFAEVMPKLILEHPQIRFNIKEIGAFSLKSELLMGSVDFAALLYPEHISKNIIDSFEIKRSELALFVSPEHRLAQEKTLTWKQLHNEKLAIFDKSFMIHHQLKEAFQKENIYPNIVLESNSWDFQLNAVRQHHNLATMLPLIIADQYPLAEAYVYKKIKNPVPWRVTLCRLKKNSYSNVENYIFDFLLKEFKVL